MEATISTVLASIPFFGLGVKEVGGIPLDPWAILVCIGFVVGLEVARARAIKLGLDVRDVVDGAVFIVGMGFLMGHVVTVVAYQPHRLETEGIWAILKFWTGFSSMGGFIGAILGAILFYGYVRPRPFWRFADVISFGFPFGWFFGRLGCSSVHDHIGRATDFPLAMDFDRGWYNFQWVDGDPYRWADGVRHELGIYEAVLVIPIMILVGWMGRKDWPPGTFTAGFFFVYSPIRFGLDFLRNTDLQSQDLRYVGLTPAQWGTILLFVGCGYVLYTRDWKGFRPWPLDGKPNQAERALGNPVPAVAVTSGGASEE